MKIGSLFFILIFGCWIAADEIQLPPTNKVTRKGVLSVSADWIKEKGDKFDIRLNLENEADFPVIVMLHELRCMRGKKEASLKHATISAALNIGEKTIDLEAHEVKSFTLVCPHRGEPIGEYKVIVKSVYSNRSGDGKTKGDLLAKDIDWAVIIKN